MSVSTNVINADMKRAIQTFADNKDKKKQIGPGGKPLLGLEEQLAAMTKEEKKVKARLENLVMGSGACSMELNMGKHCLEVLAEIPKYFMIPHLKDKKPPGKITFTAMTAGTSFILYTSFTNKKPDKKNCL